MLGLGTALRSSQLSQLNVVDDHPSYTSSARIYNIVLHDLPTGYLLLTSLDENTPPALSALLSNIISNANVPMPRPLTQSTPGRWDFNWLLMSVHSGRSSGVAPPFVTSLATLRPRLSPRQLAYVELRLGTYLRALHGLTNECFGSPIKPPSSKSSSLPFLSLPSNFGQGDMEDVSQYSWQDTFVPLLDDLLVELCEKPTFQDLCTELGINVEELRQYLSRAIGSFLFDDVEMPSLVLVSGCDADVYVSLSTSRNEAEGETNGNQAEQEVRIVYLLPTLLHALWGDPLMEAWFMPPGPSQAIREGYFGEDKDGTLILFPRQKTKRLWYTVYLALLVLVEDSRASENRDGDTNNRREVQWAKKVLPECMAALKDTPSY